MELRTIGTNAVVELPERMTGGEEGLALTDRIRTAVEQGVRHVVFECSRVTLINSSGLGVLVAALTTLRSHGGTCTLVAVPERMRTLLEVTHLDSMFTLRETIADALQ